MFNRALVVAAAVVGAPVVAGASILSDWNLVVRTNLNSSSEVDGSAIVGGNLSSANNYAVQGVTAPGNVGLAVGGTVIGGPISVNNGGNFRFAGTVSAIVNTNGGGNAAFDATIPAQVTSIFSQVNTISTYLAGLTANGTLDGAGNMNAAPALISGQRVAVYSITPAQWSSLGQMNLNFGTADSVIINVLTAGNISFVAPPNLLGGFNQANSSRILWNVPNATGITVNNTFNGALIAPSANLNLIGGAINGTVVVNSMTQDAEVRRSTYTGFVPTPGTAAGLLVGGIVALRRRR